MKIKMKKLTALILIFGIASASGANAKSNFDGPYVGLGIGYAKSTDKGNEFVDGEPSSYSQKTKPAGYLITAFAGVNKVFSNSFLLGLEADYDRRKNRDSSVQYDDGVPKYRYPVKTIVRDSASFRLRAGKVFNDDKSLAYLTAGFATVKIIRRISDTGNDPDVSESPSRRHNGWTFGFGGEHFLSDNLSAKLAYRYSRYGAKQLNGENVYDSDIIEIQNYHDHVVRAGIAYHF
jgi:opacity protein-like surface antigen